MDFKTPSPKKRSNVPPGAPMKKIGELDGLPVFQAFTNEAASDSDFEDEKPPVPVSKRVRRIEEALDALEDVIIDRRASDAKLKNRLRNEKVTPLLKNYIEERIKDDKDTDLTLKKELAWIAEEWKQLEKFKVKK